MAVVTSADAIRELVRFILARIDEDRDAQRRLARRNRTLFPSLPRAAGTAGGSWDVCRMAAETEAKRRLVGAAQQLLTFRDMPEERPVRESALAILCSLAGTYADHHGFRDDWSDHVAEADLTRDDRFLQVRGSGAGA